MIIDRNAVTQEVPIDPETGKPYLNTVAAIQVSANGVGSEVSPYVAQAVEVIRESGLPQETNALFTNVEGDLDDVLKVAGEAAKKLAEQGYRTSLVLHMDIRPGVVKPSWGGSRKRLYSAERHNPLTAPWAKYRPMSVLPPHGNHGSAFFRRGKSVSGAYIGASQPLLSFTM